MDILDLYRDWLAREYTGGALGLESPQYARLGKKNDRSFWWRSIADRLTYQQKQTAKSILHGNVLLNYPVTRGEKLFAIDYVSYILENHPSVHVDYFDQASQMEIRRFMTCHFQFAYQDYVPWGKVFPGDTHAIFQDAQKEHRNNIKKRNGIYEYLGFKTRMPGFEYGVLANHCGLDLVPANILENIKGSLFVDCGAFIGDSCYALQRYSPGAIFAIEPEEHNIGILEENIQLNHMEHVSIINAGVAEKAGEAFLDGEGIGAFVATKGSKKIKLVCIDDLKQQSKQKRVGFIKMDIEGAELGALKGAVKVLAEDKPVLSIALYHSGRDFFEIPEYIKTINERYVFSVVHTNPLTPLFEEYLIAY